MAMAHTMKSTRFVSGPGANPGATCSCREDLQRGPGTKGAGKRSFHAMICGTARPSAQTALKTSAAPNGGTSSNQKGRPPRWAVEIHRGPDGKRENHPQKSLQGIWEEGLGRNETARRRAQQRRDLCPDREGGGHQQSQLRRAGRRNLCADGL